MKTKFNFMFLVCITFVMLCSFSVISCSDDEEEDDPVVNVDDENQPSADDEEEPSVDDSSDDYDALLVGTWRILQSDPSWMSNVTFYVNGTFKSVDYYDIEGDLSFSENSGTYYGTWTIDGHRIIISPQDVNDPSVICGRYYIIKLTNTSMELDDDGYGLYGSK